MIDPPSNQIPPDMVRGTFDKRSLSLEYFLLLALSCSFILLFMVGNDATLVPNPSNFMWNSWDLGSPRLWERTLVPRPNNISKISPMYKQQTSQMDKLTIVKELLKISSFQLFIYFQLFMTFFHIMWLENQIQLGISFLGIRFFSLESAFNFCFSFWLLSPGKQEADHRKRCLMQFSILKFSKCIADPHLKSQGHCWVLRSVGTFPWIGGKVPPFEFCFTWGSLGNKIALLNKLACVFEYCICLSALIPRKLWYILIIYTLFLSFYYFWFWILFFLYGLRFCL